MPVTVFTTDVQRRIRLRNAKRFDLEPVLGESVILHVGEMPQSQQPKVVSFLSVRRELLEHTAKKSEGETPESSIQRMGEDLSKKLLRVMQELIGGALLDATGDRLEEDDARALFELLPATPEVAELMHQMSEAVLARLGGKRSEAPAVVADDQPLPK